MLNSLKTKINLNDLLLAKKIIVAAENILIVVHKNPDSDAIGSLASLADYLDKAGKKYQAFCVDPLPENLFYLMDNQRVASDKEVVAGDNFDLVVSLDCASLAYSGIGEYLSKLIERNIPIINIDHHPGSNYGQINIVDSKAGSTSLILYDILLAWGELISKRQATFLLAGILYDTNVFANSNTDAAIIKAAAELVELGGNYTNISKGFYSEKSESGFDLWSRLLSRLRKNDKLKIAYSVVLENELKRVPAVEAEGLVNFFNYLNEVKIVMLIKEIDSHQLKISLRSVSQDVDVAQLANFFGGGGHSQAAGFTIAGRMEQEGNGWRVV